MNKWRAKSVWRRKRIIGHVAPPHAKIIFILQLNHVFICFLSLLLSLLGRNPSLVGQVFESSKLPWTCGKFLWFKIFFSWPLLLSMDNSELPLGYSYYLKDKSMFPLDSSYYPIDNSEFPLGSSYYPMDNSEFPLYSSYYLMDNSMFQASIFLDIWRISIWPP